MIMIHEKLISQKLQKKIKFTLKLIFIKKNIVLILNIAHFLILDTEKPCMLFFSKSSISFCKQFYESMFSCNGDPLPISEYMSSSSSSFSLNFSTLKYYFMGLNNSS